MNRASIEQLYIYPVKSLAGVAVTQAQATPKGLAGDREWMIVNEANRFVTQRTLPSLVTIHSRLRGDDLTLSHLEAGEMPVTPPCANTEPETVTVWKDTCLARPAPPEVNQWLTRVAGADESLRLMQFAKEHHRAAQSERFGRHNTHFADAAPILVTNTASLTALNNTLTDSGKTPVSMLRFRPNIVINGLPPFAEHEIKTMSHGCGEYFSLVDHCQRCIVITVDPHTGERTPGNEPFKTLSAINSMPDNPKAPAFGVNSTFSGTAILSVGDSLNF